MRFLTSRHIRMPWGASGIRGIAAALAALLCMAAAVAVWAWPSTGSSAAQPVAAASSAPHLPLPTGRLGVGRSVLHLVDRQRRDPWVPSAGPRQLMVSVYYPAHRGTGTPAPYMTVEEARLFLKMKDSTAPPALLAGLGTSARSGARPLHGRYPLVVLSPGFTWPRATLTSLAEDLTSHGYVVALVDHTYEAAGVTFPDGRTLACAAVCYQPPPGGLATVAESRAKDVSFVINQLTGPRPAWPHATMIDRNRIGMAGHSIGGNAAATTMASDARVRAGVNMDGTFFAPMPTSGLGHRPFLMFGEVAKDGTWDKAWQRLDGWKRWLTVAGADHSDFTDFPILAALGGRPVTMPPQRAVAITRAYVAAFFDLALKHRHEPLLDGPTKAYPEVAFHPA